MVLFGSALCSVRVCLCGWPGVLRYCVCLCVLGNTCSVSPQAGLGEMPGEMALLPLLGLIWQPLTDIHYIKLPERSHCEVIFFSVTFKGGDRSLRFRTPVSIHKKKKFKKLI